MHSKLISLALCSALAVTGCASDNSAGSTTGRDTAIGAGVGAVAGAVIGKASGSDHVGRDAVIGAGVGAVGGYIWSKKMEEQKRQMEQATRGTGIQVKRTADNQLELAIPADASFAVGSTAIKPTLKPVLDKLARSLIDNPVTQIRIVGHTDNTGSDAINNPLSVNRAASTRDYLSARAVKVSRMSIDGRGSHEPVADNGSAAGKARNRRVEIFIAEAAK